MKYIRTIDGKIINTTSYDIKKEIIINDEHKCYIFMNNIPHNSIIEHEVMTKDIINQADTIEELCDEFVYVGLDYPKVLDTYHDFGQIDVNQVLFNMTLHKDSCLYGAIWTDKGLIYVAKMNEKGELELIWNIML